jgi:hypothetical protein
MKRSPFLPAVVAAMVLVFAVPCAADESSAVAAPGTLKLPTQIVYGRPDKPNVVIVVKTPTAAAAAGAAHDAMRTSWMWRVEPAPLRDAR